MKKLLIRLGLGLALLLPSIALATANSVTLTKTSTVIYVGGINLTVAGSDATLASIQITSNGFAATMTNGSAVSVQSADKRSLGYSNTTNTAVMTFSCNSSYSELDATSTGDDVVNVTVDPATCTTNINGGGNGGGVGGGGGGGGSYTPTPLTTNSTSTATSTPIPAPTVTAPTTVGAPVSGLTEIQVQSILSLLASFNADQSVINSVNASLHGQSTSGATQGTLAGGTFMRDLKVGMTGADVKALQVFLNAHGFVIAASGSGSPGNETTLFGGRTRAALAKFQAANGLSPAAGYFGPKTRAKVNTLAQ